MDAAGVMSEGTIFALSSGVGRAGVAVIRVSGPLSSEAVRLFCRRELKPRTAHISDIYDYGSELVIDRGLVLWFPGPNSFTGEDIVEFQVHGGRAVVSALLHALSQIPGLRAANPGEFTRRAFDNGKLDLTSAEGLADLISADTELQRRQAMGQFSGRLSEAARFWRRSLVETRALIEAYLDFPDEGEIPMDISDELGRVLAEVELSLSNALNGYSEAEIIRDGAVVLIAGPPNSGKSSLLNRLASREVAIISEIPGTTRDLIELTLDIRGLPFTFIDSAGIRETTDPIEAQGIERTRRRASDAHVVLWLSPVDEPMSEPQIKHENLWVLNTKADLRPDLAIEDSISTATGAGVRNLLQKLSEHFNPRLDRLESNLLANRRQFEAITAGRSAIRSAMTQLDCRRLEFVAEDLRRGTLALDELVGDIPNDGILSEVFSRFCLGK
jgi:tRNA modification GTPase